jgi:hypothetical protein
MRDARSARHLLVDAAVRANRGNLDVSFFFGHVVEANGQLGSDGEPVRRDERLDVEGQARLADEVVASFAGLRAVDREDHFRAVGDGGGRVGDGCALRSGAKHEHGRSAARERVRRESLCGFRIDGNRILHTTGKPDDEARDGRVGPARNAGHREIERHRLARRGAERGCSGRRPHGDEGLGVPGQRQCGPLGNLGRQHSRGIVFVDVGRWIGDLAHGLLLDARLLRLARGPKRYRERRAQQARRHSHGGQLSNKWRQKETRKLRQRTTARRPSTRFVRFWQKMRLATPGVTPCET